MPSQEWIRATLKDKGYKLKDVAEALALPAPRITDILKGAREVQADEVVPLADMLGMNPRSLLKSLEQGQKIILPGGDSPTLPLLGCLTASGDITDLPADLGFGEVAPPPDAATHEGLSCYVMGDASMGAEVREGSLLIAADPKQHFAPFVPGSLLLVRLAGDKLALRIYEKDANGADWLVTGDPDAKDRWRFSLLSDLLPTGASSAPTFRPDDIAAVVLWVQERRAPRSPF